MTTLNANELLTQIKVASPCTARWGHMVGDDRVRLCHQCRKHVYNLSAMSAEEAAALVRATEGRICARFYRRADGTMLTADCPVGAAWLVQRVRKFCWAGIAALAVALTSCVARNVTEQLPSEAGRSRGRWSIALNRAMEKVKQGLWPSRLQRPGRNPGFIMGEVCIPAPPAKVPPTPAQTPKGAPSDR